jgi:hypothetical protein
MTKKEIKIPLMGLIYTAIFLFALMNISGFLNSHLLVHIRIGEWMIENGAIIKNDIFSYGGTEEWINYYWLTDVIYAFLYNKFGIGSILIIHASIIAMSFSLIILFLYKKGINIFFVTLYLSFGIYASLPQWGAWPYAFNFLFLTLFLYLFEDYYKNGKKINIFYIIILQLLWVNMNSEFFYSYLIILIYIVSDIYYCLKKEEEAKIKLKITLTIFLILLPIIYINPFGFKEVSNVFTGYLSMIKDRRNDWAAPDFHTFAKFSNKFLVLSVFLIYYFKKKNIGKEVKYIVIYLIAIFAFLYAQRHIMIFIIISTMIVPNLIECNKEIKNKYLDKIFKKINSNSIIIYNMMSKKIINIIIIITVTMLFSISIKSSESTFHEIISSWARSSGIKYLKENNIEGNGFHNDGQGDMIIWYNSPKTKVFVDSREGIYSGKHQNDYSKVMLLKDGWEKILEKNKINWILLQQSQLTTILKTLDDKWIVVYESQASVLFLKKEYYEKVKDRIKKVEE